jgi:hypothetical protein
MSHDGSYQVEGVLWRVAEYNRKYGIRILAIKHHESKNLSGKNKTYSERSVRHLKSLWVIMGEMSSKNLALVMKIQIRIRI